MSSWACKKTLMDMVRGSLLHTGSNLSLWPKHTDMLGCGAMASGGRVDIVEEKKYYEALVKAIKFFIFPIFYIFLILKFFLAVIWTIFVVSFCFFIAINTFQNKSPVTIVHCLLLFVNCLCSKKEFWKPKLFFWSR